MLRLTVMLLASLAFADDSLVFKEPEIPLWPNAAPGPKETWNPSTDGFHRVTNVHNPTITVFLPPAGKATGVGFVICPGGGHRYLVMDLEGANVAHKLNAMGVAAFVLKSRLARAPDSEYKVEVESLADAQQAMRLVRSRAKEWGVEKLGIMGFSAGGELAALVETRFDDAARPDFAVLGYPGLKPANFTIPKNTPPTFIVVNADDNLSSASAEYYVLLKKAGIPAELHIYAEGGHGFGMTGRNAEFAKLPVSTWPDRLHEWMVNRKILP